MHFRMDMYFVLNVSVVLYVLVVIYLKLHGFNSNGTLGEAI